MIQPIEEDKIKKTQDTGLTVQNGIEYQMNDEHLFINSLCLRESFHILQYVQKLTKNSFYKPWFFL